MSAESRNEAAGEAPPPESAVDAALDHEAAGQADERDSAPRPGSDLELVLAERDRYLELAKRTRAEFENYQKRASRDHEIERRYAAWPFLSDMVPVLDNFERAVQAGRGPGANLDSLLVGVEMVGRQMMEMFGRHGVARLAPERGEPFDPNLHQAISQAPSADLPPLAVLHLAQPGYKFHDRVLRPAQVVVACPPPQPVADGTAIE